jgi:hypothetical protein
MGWFTGRSKPKTNAFSLNRPLLSFSKDDHWTVEDSFTSVHILGGVGSGKTSGSGAAIASALLNPGYGGDDGYGGVVMTAKPGEAERWLKAIAAAGRSKDVVILSPNSPHRFNVIQNEWEQSGRDAESLVDLFTQSSESLGNGRGEKNDFWKFKTQQLIRNAVTALGFTGRKFGLLDIYQMVTTAPQSIEHAASDHFEQSFCYAALCEARAGAEAAGRGREMELVAQFFLEEWAMLAPETRTSILANFTGQVDPLLRGTLFDILNTTTTVTPADCLSGKIIILDFPSKLSVGGKIVQVMFKYSAQRTFERLPVTPDRRPVFIWADEAQNFVTSYDCQFLATSREVRVCSVNLTQNISNYYAVLGGDTRGKAETDSLIANFGTKIFHANGDPVTNQWAADFIGRSWHTRFGTSQSESYPNGYGAGPNRSGQTGLNSNQSFDYELQPNAFLTLATGGAAHRFAVDAYITQAGRIWEINRQTFLKVRFEQSL